MRAGRARSDNRRQQQSCGGGGSSMQQRGWLGSSRAVSLSGVGRLPSLTKGHYFSCHPSPEGVTRGTAEGELAHPASPQGTGLEIELAHPASSTVRGSRAPYPVGTPRAHALQAGRAGAPRADRIDQLSRPYGCMASSLGPVSQAIGLARHLLGASPLDSCCAARQSLGLARRPLGASPLDSRNRPLA
eukprot:SM000610S19831  [mRNA]  locus=s610:36:1096:- [translate_table: standard]